MKNLMCDSFLVLGFQWLLTVNLSAGQKLKSTGAENKERDH